MKIFAFFRHEFLRPYCHMRHVFLFGALLLYLFSSAQVSAVKPLHIGDTLPVIPNGSIINYHESSAALSDFKNDLVILDFWSTWCVPCVEAMPRFEALQQRFKGRVQFVLTTPQEKDKIEKFLAKKKVALPCFVEDKELSKYFPHNSVPHEVWIKAGKVIAITYAEIVTEENIQKILDGEEVHLVEKKSNFDYDIFQPLLVSGNGGNTNDLLYHSVIAGYLDGVANGGGVMTDSLNRYKIYLIDASIARMYATAARHQYNNTDFLLPNRTIIEASGLETIKPSYSPLYTPNVRKHFYCYELAVPVAAKAEAGRFMMEDLNRYFGIVYHIKGAIEKRKVLCWVLRKKDSILTISTKGGTSKITYKDDYAIWVNKSFDDFFSSLTYINRNQSHPFVNRTNIKDNIDIILPLNLKDVAAVQAYLPKYGLKLTEEECELYMLVIKDIP